MYVKGCISFQMDHQCMRIPVSLYYDQHSPLLYYIESKTLFLTISTSLKSDASCSQKCLIFNDIQCYYFNFYRFDNRKEMSNIFL